MKFFRMLKNAIYNFFVRIVLFFKCLFCSPAACRGENYVDSGVKILIAIVIGGLLLALLYSLFGDTIMPTVTARVEEMFNYAG